MSSAIPVISETIIGILRIACLTTDFPGIEFNLYQASDFKNAIKLGFSLYLYQVTPNTARRNFPGRLDPSGQRQRPPVVVDLHFLLSVWASTATSQMQLLGRAIHALEDTPLLTAGLLNSGANAPATFSTNESVELVLEQLPLQEINILWEMIHKTQQFSIGIVARGVNLD